MTYQEIRYDQIRAGDVILFHGAKELVTETVDEGESEYYPGERVIRFTIQPFDAEAEAILGRFYSRGTYGGVGWLPIDLVSRGIQQ